MSDLSTTSWSEVDASNNQQPPEGWPTGMASNQVEPAARMNMAAVKRFWNRINAVYLATLTTTDTFAVTETQALVGYGLNEKRATRFPNANVSTSVTINHSALGAQFFKKWNNAGALVNIASGDIQAQEHEYYWDGSEMVLLNPANIMVTGTSFGNLSTKAQPTSSDSILVTDAAAANAAKTSLISTLAALPGTYPTKASPTSSDSIVITDAAASAAGKQALVSAIVAASQPVLSKITNSLGADVNLTIQSTYFDGPSVAQGATGTWFASGAITLLDTSISAIFDVKLWDGATVIASAETQSAATTDRITVSLSGFITNPAGNIRISAADNTSANGSMRFNVSGNSKDCTLTAIRIA